MDHCFELHASCSLIDTAVDPQLILPSARI